MDNLSFPDVLEWVRYPTMILVFLILVLAVVGGIDSCWI